MRSLSTIEPGARRSEGYCRLSLRAAITRSWTTRGGMTSCVGWDGGHPFNGGDTSLGAGLEPLGEHPTIKLAEIVRPARQLLGVPVVPPAVRRLGDHDAQRRACDRVGEGRDRRR